VSRPQECFSDFLQNGFMKTILIILSLLLSPLTKAEELSLFVRTSDENKVIRVETGDTIPVIPGNEEVKKNLNSLSPSSEVFLSGHINYQRNTELHELKPFFIISSVKAVSFKDLRPEMKYEEKPQLTFSESPLIIRPSFNVTTEVASAITFTTSLLMLEDLSSQKGLDPEGRRQIRQALFLSAGTMATLSFLYEQLSGKTKP
jgi:hypothetical protein